MARQGFCLWLTGLSGSGKTTLATALYESRDVKGLYAKARRGEIRHVVGIDDAYEAPDDADLQLDTSASTVQADIQAILSSLRGRLIQ